MQNWRDKHLKLSQIGLRRDSWRRGVPRDAGLRPHFGRFENRAAQDPHHFRAEFLVLRQFRFLIPLPRREGLGEGDSGHSVSVIISPKPRPFRQ